jgi:hypothetical protein
MVAEPNSPAGPPKLVKGGSGRTRDNDALCDLAASTEDAWRPQAAFVVRRLSGAPQSKLY